MTAINGASQPSPPASGWEPFPLPGSGRIVGQINRKTRTYRTFRDHGRHLIRIKRAYGLGVRVMDALVREGVEWVELDERRASGSLWRIRHPLAKWLRAPRATFRASDGEQAYISLESLGVGVKIREAPPRPQHVTPKPRWES